MKISYMLKREDFYTVNQKTLESFFNNNGELTKLYIYPELNAVIRKFPSKKVKQYLYTEFHVNAAWYKRLLVWIYTRICLNSAGLLAAKKIEICADINKDMLIYPCNRKYRIFDFRTNSVAVVAKSGFPIDCLKTEISFRNNTECDFILPITGFTDMSYSERIIDGMPLARLTENKVVLKDKAKKIWFDYISDYKITVSLAIYSETLEKRACELKEQAISRKKNIDLPLLEETIDLLKKETDKDILIDISLSHGDLQEGNIWVENHTGKIYIIDWESVETRSIWYDECVLEDGIRISDNLDAFIKINDIKHKVVCFEELIYRTNELCQLPHNYGENDFNEFLNQLYRGIKDV